MEKDLKAVFDRDGYVVVRKAIDAHWWPRHSGMCTGSWRRTPGVRPEQLHAHLACNDPFWMRLVGDSRPAGCRPAVRRTRHRPCLPRTTSASRRAPVRQCSGIRMAAIGRSNRWTCHPVACGRRLHAGERLHACHPADAPPRPREGAGAEGRRQCPGFCDEQRIRGRVDGPSTSFSRPGTSPSITPI